MNKLDRPSMSPLELIDQLEKVLNIHAFPVNWPLGNGPMFKGIFDRINKEVHLFERVSAGAYRAPVSVHDLSNPFVKEILHEDIYQEVVEELQMLDIAQEGFDINAVLQGKTTPVFFGSAMNNFGVEFLLKGFLEHSVGPAPRVAKCGLIPLDRPDFSAFIFKVQSNMNPLHRDRIVFARVCSGRFFRDMKVFHQRSGREIRLSDSFKLFGRDREIVAEAYPGDILGFVTKIDYRIGDTISVDPGIVFDEIPRFAPECFAYLHNSAASTYKPFRKGLDHLLAEDIVQTFSVLRNGGTIPLLGAVGPLQFEVLQYRLKDEYGGVSRLEMQPWKILRWVGDSFNEEELIATQSTEVALGRDNQGRMVILFQSDWSLKYYMKLHPDIKLLDTPVMLNNDIITK